MVEIGEGNVPGSDWWAVAGIDGGSVWASTWITDAPSNADDPTWIEVLITEGVGSGDWNDVHWPPERLARGQEAVDMAYTCLSQQKR